MSFLSYLAAFLFVLFASGADSAVEVKKAVGDAVSFSPASAIPPGASIIWKHRSDSGVVIKVIEYDEDGENIPNLNFQGITTLNKKTGEITIKDLKPVHIGVYTIDINSKEQEQKFNLTFMERVPKPVIKLEEIPNNPDVMYLRCEYSETIIWRNSDGETLHGSVISPKGQSTTVHKEGKPEKFYTCTLKNDVSEETSERVYESDLFKDKGSSQTPAIIGGFFGIFALILLIPVVLYNAITPFHDLIYKNFGKSPCIGVVLDFLDCKKKDQGKKDGEATGNDPASSTPLKNHTQANSTLQGNQTQGENNGGGAEDRYVNISELKNQSQDEGENLGELEYVLGENNAGGAEDGYVNISELKNHTQGENNAGGAENDHANSTLQGNQTQDGDKDDDPQDSVRTETETTSAAPQP